MSMLSVFLVSTFASNAVPSGITVSIGRPETEAVSPIKLHSFGEPEKKGERWCRNTDETGVGDGKAGYAAVEVPATVGKEPCEVRMEVWGESDAFSFVAHNGTEYRAVAKGQPSGQPHWEEVRFALRPSDLNAGGKMQRFGFSSKDRQVWVSRFTFRSFGASPVDRKALAAAQEKAKPGEIVIAAEGSLVASICVSPENDSVLYYSAEELQRYMLDMSGAFMPISSQPSSPCIRIAVDAGSFADGDGFSLKTDGTDIWIRGGSPLGTLYGVYAFLEQLGCRWVSPGPLGDVVPKRDPLIVPVLDVHEEPDFRIRWIGQGDWALKNRCNVNATVAGERVGIVWKWSYHSFFGLLPPDRYWDEHPEYYPLINGRRRKPDGYSNTQLCTTNPDVIREVADNIIEIFRADPRIDVVALCPNDGGGFCMCPNCTALDRPDPDFWGRYSDRLAPFNNAVAQRVAQVFPNKILKTGAYANYMRYPLDPDYRPEPNLAVQACHTYSCNNHAINDPNCERNRLYFREPLEKWAKHSKHLWIYEYYIKGAWAGLLYTQTHIMQRDIAYYRKIGAESFYTQWSAGACGSVGLDFYVATRLAWDVTANVDALIEDYCNAYYETAGKPMIQFYRRLARAFVESGDCISPFGYKRVWIAAPQIFTPEALADLGACLVRAEQLAPHDAVRQRLEPVQFTFEYTRRAMAYLAAIVACFDGIESPASPGVPAAEAKAKEVGKAASEDVIAYLDQHGLGKAARAPRSKMAQLLCVYRNPRTAVGRWHQLKTGSQHVAVPSLPPIPGSRLVGTVSERARVRLDPADEGLKSGWNELKFDDSAWKESPFPSYWQDIGLAEPGYRGFGWYRTSFTLPPKALPKGMRLMLRFEGVDAAGTVFVNGQTVGEHPFVSGRSWQVPFELDVTEVTREGENSLVLRVYTGGGKGGVYAPITLYRLGDEPEDFMR